MSHHSRIWPAGLTDGASKLPHAELEALDTNVFGSVDGDTGGTWAPAAAIVIGGAGIDPTLKAAEWPNFAADGGAIRTISRVLFVTPYTRLNAGGVIVSSGHVQGQGVGVAFSRLLDAVPHGATITSITCRVLIKNTHASLPTTFPMMSVQRIDEATGGLVTFLKGGIPPDAGAGVNEYFVGAPVASTAAYNALGAVQFTYTPDQNNVINRTLYSYVISVFDEAGGGAIVGNLFYAFTVTFTATQLEIA